MYMLTDKQIEKGYFGLPFSRQRTNIANMTDEANCALPAHSCGVIMMRRAEESVILRQRSGTF